LLVTGNTPSGVFPLTASIVAVNCEGPSAWIIAPTPDTGVANVSVRGPLPSLPESEVHSTLSPAVKPAPPQLQGVAGHTTAIRLLGPVSEIEP
jgi:hypothetical protein